MVILCTIGYFFSWKNASKDRYKIAVALLILCGLILRIYTACDFFLHPWDERYHALVAKHMMQHPFTPTLYEKTPLPYSFKEWTINHVWLHKQPLSLWAMAASMKIFGVNEIALRIPSILFSTAGIWLAFFIGKYFTNEKAAFIAAFLYSVNGFIIELASGRTTTDHVDVAFLFFIELAIFFAVLHVQKLKNLWSVCAGISIGLAILSKWLPALIALPIWLLLAVDSRKFTLKSIFINFIIIIGCAAVVALPWQLYIFHAFPLEARWESAYNFKHITSVIEGHEGPFYYYFDVIRMNYGDLLYIPLIWFFWNLFKRYYDLKMLALFLWWVIPCLFFSFVKTKMNGYVLFTAPALFIITGGFYNYVSELNLQKRSRFWVYGLLSLFILLPIRYTIERIKPFDNVDRRPMWVKEINNLDQRNIKDGVLFNYHYPIEVMFYTNLTAYETLPDVATIKNLLSNGYTVIINDDKNIPIEVRTIAGINWTKLPNP